MVSTIHLPCRHRLCDRDGLAAGVQGALEIIAAR
jgi:hypothetical protein